MANLSQTKYPNNIRTVSNAVPLSTNIYKEDSVLECDTSVAGAVNLNLLGIPLNYFSTQYKLYVVDKSNNASVNNIVINAGTGTDANGLPVAQTINGGSSITINTNGGGVLIRVIDNYKYLATFNNSADGYITVQDEGVALPQRSILNFTGLGVTATDDALNSRTNVEVQGGSLGGVLVVADLDKVAINVSGQRGINTGTIQTSNWIVPQEYGTCVGSFNQGTGVWTCPLTGVYNFSILFSLSADDSPYNNLFSINNPNGFVGNGAPPIDSYTIAATPQTLRFPDYFGYFSAGITNSAGTITLTSNTSVVTYDTSQIIISASYIGRRLNAGTTWVCRWVNRVRNNMVGSEGNSFHFCVEHTKS